MANAFLYVLTISLTIFILNPTVDCRSRVRAYVEHQCRPTLYNELCVRTLLPFVNKTNAPAPKQLARISLTSCLYEARLTKAYVNRVATKFSKTKNARYKEAVAICLSQINDGVSQLTQSVKEQQKTGKDAVKFVEHESNVETWVVSAALTDAATCVDMISSKAIGGKEKRLIKSKVLNVKHLVSNAVTLIKRYG